MPEKTIHTGWAVSLWTMTVAHIPSANECLVYVSLAVGALQAVVLMMQIRRGGRRKEFLKSNKDKRKKTEGK